MEVLLERREEKLWRGGGMILGFFLSKGKLVECGVNNWSWFILEDKINIIIEREKVEVYKKRK